MADEGKSAVLIPAAQIEGMILLIRGQKVILDVDLAALYSVTTKALNQAVRRNRNRFPGDFMFRLSPAETQAMRSQFVTASAAESLRSQIVTASKRNVRFQPYAFTEQDCHAVQRAPK